MQYKVKKFPLFLTPVKAGFPSPATDLIEAKLDLNSYLVKHPTATFFVRVSGNSMLGAGIDTGDILIVDRSLDPKPSDIILAILDGEFTVKRLIKKKDVYFLKAENADYKEILISEASDFAVWGVVTTVIKKFK